MSVTRLPYDDEGLRTLSPCKVFLPASFDIDTCARCGCSVGHHTWRALIRGWYRELKMRWRWRDAQ